MIARWCQFACLCLCCFIAGSSASWAQESHLDTPGEIPKYVRDPIPLYTTGLGPFHRPITTTNTEAQAFFDQGFQMMYAFARRSEEHTSELQSTCNLVCRLLLNKNKIIYHYII